jgi:hypothetical protein
MIYLGAHWFQGGSTTLIPPWASDHKLRFYIGELWSTVAHDNKRLHKYVLPEWWSETALDAAGNPTTQWAYDCLWRHWRYALEPGTMWFHCIRLQPVFFKPESIPTLWRAIPDGTPGTQPSSTTWRAQVKTFNTIERLRRNPLLKFNTIERLRRNRWLKAVSIIIRCCFEQEEGSTDVVSLILNHLRDWACSDTSGQFTRARYVLDEGVEEALYATYSYTPNKRRRVN